MRLYPYISLPPSLPPSLPRLPKPARGPEPPAPPRAVNARPPPGRRAPYRLLTLGCGRSAHLNGPAELTGDVAIGSDDIGAPTHPKPHPTPPPPHPPHPTPHPQPPSTQPPSSRQTARESRAGGYRGIEPDGGVARLPSPQPAPARLAGLRSTADTDGRADGDAPNGRQAGRQAGPGPTWRCPPLCPAGGRSPSGARTPRRPPPPPPPTPPSTALRRRRRRRRRAERRRRRACGWRWTRWAGTRCVHGLSAEGPPGGGGAGIATEAGSGRCKAAKAAAEVRMGRRTRTRAARAVLHVHVVCRQGRLGRGGQKA